VRALADHLARSVRSQERPLGIEGMDSAQWVLIDFGDVVVHIQIEQVREYYDLDGLFANATEVPCLAKT
jgi:ribosome-associated protein